jgi:hypothetical protein
MNQITREAWLLVEAFLQAVAVEQSGMREGIGSGQIVIEVETRHQRS